MSGKIRQNLSPQEAEALELRLQGQDATQIAEALEISLRQVYRYFAKPLFKELLREARIARLRAISRSIDDVAPSAVLTLMLIAEDKEIPADQRIDALKLFFQTAGMTADAMVELRRTDMEQTNGEDDLTPEELKALASPSPVPEDDDYEPPGEG